MTKLEQQYAKMTPAQRKKATAAISAQMGMPPKKSSSGTRKSSARSRKK